MQLTFESFYQWKNTKKQQEESQKDGGNRRDSAPVEGGKKQHRICSGWRRQKTGRQMGVAR